MNEYIPSNEEELIAKEIVDAAYNVHKNLGPRFVYLNYPS